jgi:hypothetical protein
VSPDGAIFLRNKLKSDPSVVELSDTVASGLAVRLKKKKRRWMKEWLKKRKEMSTPLKIY